MTRDRKRWSPAESAYKSCRHLRKI